MISLRARVAGDDAQLRAQHVVEHGGEIAARSSLIGGADDELLGQRVLKRFRRRVGARDADEHLVVGVAQIDELARIVLDRIADSGCRMAPEKIAPTAVPSLGATEYMKPASLLVPAPGMFCGTTAGLPGM